MQKLNELLNDDLEEEEEDDEGPLPQAQLVYNLQNYTELDELYI